MPKPKNAEKKSDFIGRCISEVVKEGKDQKQAAAICYSVWEEAKSSNATAEIGGEEYFLQIKG